MKCARPISDVNIAIPGERSHAKVPIECGATYPARFLPGPLQRPRDPKYSVWAPPLPPTLRTHVVAAAVVWFVPPRVTPVRWSGLWKPSLRRRAAVFPVYLCVYLYIRLCLPPFLPVSSCMCVYTFVCNCVNICCVYKNVATYVSPSVYLHVCISCISVCWHLMSAVGAFAFMSADLCVH